MSERPAAPPRPTWLDSLMLSWLALGGAIGLTLTLHRAGMYAPLPGSRLLEPGPQLLGLDGEQLPLVARAALNALVYVWPLHFLRILIARVNPNAHWPRRMRSFFALCALALVPLTAWLGKPVPGELVSPRVPPVMARMLAERFPPPPALDESTARVEFEILEATNRARADHDLGPLSFDPALAEVARAHSLDMTAHRFFAHVNLSGDDATERARRASYPVERRISRDRVSVGIAENIGLSAPSIARRTPARVAEELVGHWMTSTGHRANLLNGNFDTLGVGVAFDGFRYAATQNFR